ncbi:GT99 family glycosyltransferase N-terminal domain-containing protein [Tatumella ptyseos]|uniref:GT99 family glycosyltransferase N-terminal domain-containing protein n=1 Tax=Tatumella ptyseos TaxID=82987 RepID=UPI0026F0F0C8|nr:glycosyltransferase [Tatumella ptyseos]WKX26173.1 glycosyltransferase [Tatumella ptyseos]
MISVYLPAYPFRGVEAPYLWFFYRILKSFSEPVSFLVGKQYLLPVGHWMLKNRWEMENDSQVRLGYELPDIQEIYNLHHINIIDESCFSNYLKKENNNPNNLFRRFITEIIPELELEFYRVFKENNSLECVLTWCNCPSLNSAAKHFGIRVINMELGPLRSPYYLSTAYLDFCGVNGNTEAEKRFLESDFYLQDDITLSEIYEFFFESNLNLTNDEAAHSGSSQSQGSLISNEIEKVYDIGIVLQVENDSNIIAFSNSFNNQSLLDYVECNFMGSKLIRVHPGSQFTLKDINEVDNSTSPIAFIKKCKRIITINSSIGLEALLLDVPVTILGECSYSFCNVEDSDERTRRLAFYLLSYLVPFDLLFDKNYIRFRLGARDDYVIANRHVDYYIASRKTSNEIKGIESNQLINGDSSVEEIVLNSKNVIEKMKDYLKEKKAEHYNSGDKVKVVNTLPAEKCLDVIVDVVVPVYGGKQETIECIESVVSTLPSWAQLVVINDVSPEPELTEWLREQAVSKEFLLIENEENCGFVASVNLGMKLHPDRDILLLNSDVEVANDWLQRIHDAAYSLDKVGSITPFSNNATICSFPKFCEDNALFMGLNVRQLDEHFSLLGKENNLIEIPTGVGFCMYIRRDCLDEVGYFDVETFGKGYGEENDWCQRAAKAGWPNFHQLNVFVYHKGGVSFADEQNPRKNRALEHLTKLHPNYTKDVMDFVANDPAKKARSEILIRILASREITKILLVSHKMGGGVNTHIQELARFYNNEVIFFLLSPEEDGKSITLTLNISEDISPEKFIIDVDYGYSTLIELLRFIGVGHVHFHHLMGVNEKILNIKNDLSCGYDITIHDYYLINANASLTDKNGSFAGDTPRVRDKRCAANSHLPAGFTARQWRNKFISWLNGADRVIFPSADTKKRFMNSYPHLTTPTIVAWHPDSEVAAPYPKASFNYVAGKKLKILVLGAISREKGALLLEEVATLLKGKEIEFHLLGYAFRPLNSVITHGPYLNGELHRKLNAIAPHMMWYPALCPETYSYTFSAALERGVPIIAPNIGAFSERVYGRAFTRIVEWNIEAKEMSELFLTLMKDPASFFITKNAKPIMDISGVEISKDFYRNSYLKKEWYRVNEYSDIDIKDLLYSKDLIFIPKGGAGPLGRKEKILKAIWMISQVKYLSYMNKIIPYPIKRFIKRRLSRRAIHEVIS